MTCADTMVEWWHTSTQEDIMVWKEVKSWATQHGYQIERYSIDKLNNKYRYTWKQDDRCGEEYSTLSLIKSIYNQITEYKYVEHQNQYCSQQIINYDDLSH